MVRKFVANFTFEFLQFSRKKITSLLHPLYYVKEKKEKERNEFTTIKVEALRFKTERPNGSLHDLSLLHQFKSFHCHCALCCVRDQNQNQSKEISIYGSTNSQ